MCHGIIAFEGNFPTDPEHPTDMQTQRKLILYIATSLDGYIANENDDLAFLDRVAEEGEDYGYAAFTETVDTVIMGRRTYDKVVAMGVPDPHPERTVCDHTYRTHISEQPPFSYRRCDGASAQTESRTWKGHLL